VLLDDEIRIIWNAATEYPFGMLVRLLLLTGQRRGETTALKWDYIDLERGTIFLPRAITKNNRDHLIPLGELGRSHIASIPRACEYLFPARGYSDRPYCGWSKGKAALDRAYVLPQWGLHDIRRTVATNLAALNTPPHVVEKLLNHASGTISGVAAIYNRFQYLDEMRDGLTKWEARLTSIVSADTLAPATIEAVK
jgi:integrase